MLPIIESKSVSINLWEGRVIPPARRILLVSADLQARVRLQGALEARGVELLSRSPDAAMPDPPPESVVLDLDALGAEGATRWVALAAGRSRIVGFFSHVDTDLGDRAQALGIETFRRGRFWKAAAEILEGPSQRDR